MLRDVPAGSKNTEARELAAAYLAQFEHTGVHSQELAKRLLEVATSDDRFAAASGTEAVFQRVVEPWGDCFEKRLCDAYTEFFSQAIDFCRRLPGGRALDQTLRTFGLSDHGQFLQRARRVQQPRPFRSDELSSVEKVLILSRVTLGADVAVTSVLVNKLKSVSPRAEVRLVGGEKAANFFASDARVSHAAFDYGRSATLIERLALWPELVGMIKKELAGLRAEQYLVVDPDSRLAQLGLLPVVQDESRYRFFPSRSYEHAGAEALGDLTSCWAGEVWGSDRERPFPAVSLSEDDRDRGLALRERVEGRLATVNLGVGIVGSGAGRPHREGRFGQVRPVGEPLHVLSREVAGVENDGDRVASVGGGGEHVHLVKGSSWHGSTVSSSAGGSSYGLGDTPSS